MARTVMVLTGSAVTLAGVAAGLEPDTLLVRTLLAVAWAGVATTIADQLISLMLHTDYRQS
jgi:hypothetical protein